MTGSTVSQAFPAAISASLGGDASAAGQAGGDLFAQLFAAVDGLSASPATGGVLSGDLTLEAVSVGQNLELVSEAEQEIADAALAALASQQLVPAPIEANDDAEILPEIRIYECWAAGEGCTKHGENVESVNPDATDSDEAGTSEIRLDVIDTSPEPEELHVRDTSDAVTDETVNTASSVSTELLEPNLTLTDRTTAVGTETIDTASLRYDGAAPVVLTNAEIVSAFDTAQASGHHSDQQLTLSTNDVALNTLLAVISGQPTETSHPQNAEGSIDRQAFTTNSDVFRAHPIQTNLWPSDLNLQDSAVLQSLHSAEVNTSTVPEATSTVAPAIIVGADQQSQNLDALNSSGQQAIDPRLGQSPNTPEASPVHVPPPVKLNNGISSVLEAHAPAGVAGTTAEQAASSAQSSGLAGLRTKDLETSVPAERVTRERRPLSSVSQLTARAASVVGEDAVSLTANEELSQPAVQDVLFAQPASGQQSEVAELVSQLDTRNTDPIELPSSIPFSGELSSANELAGAQNSRIPFAAPGQPLTTQLLTAVVQALATVEQADSDSLTLRLDPPELGELEIEFRNTDNGTQVRVGAREGVTLEMLLARSGEIERLLRGQALDINKVEFVKYEGQSSSGTDAGSSHHQQQPKQQWREGLPNPQPATVGFPGAPQGKQQPSTSTAQRIRA